MPTRLQDLLTYALLLGVLVLALLGIHGCGASAPPMPRWQDRVDVTSAVYIHGDGVACSGVAVDDHIVITAAHCMQHAMEEAVPAPGDDPRRIEEVLAYAPDSDVAWVRVGGAPLPVQARMSARAVHPGEIVFAAGFGCYGSLAVYPGIRTDLPDADGQDVYAMAVCRGDSGGPVFDEHGALVGILSAKAVESPLAYAER